MFNPHRSRWILVALLVLALTLILTAFWWVPSVWDWYGVPVVSWLSGPFHTWLQANGTDIQTLAVIGGVVAAAVGGTVRWFKRSSRRRTGATPAGAPPRTAEEDDFAVLLDHVNSHVNDRIADTLHLKAELAIRRVSDPTAIQRPWRRELTRGAAPAVPVAADEPTERFIAGPGSLLLILGEPGAGKSVEVVLLARSLLTRARAAQRGPGSADPAGAGPAATAAAITSASARAPVLLYLSSWDEKRLPLGQWIAAEVQRLYGITARVGADWLARGRLLPLLDGLDEVAEAHRAACAEAIDAFRVEHPGVSLVVTCRTAEYRKLPRALQHGDAIRLLPLEHAQIEGYLQGASPALDGLRQAMAQDRWLAEMATSPFWLRAMGLAYRDQTVAQVIATLPAPAGTDQVQGHHAAVCDAYLNEALRRKDYLPERGYTEAQTRRWLTRLAVEQERRGPDPAATRGRRLVAHPWRVPTAPRRPRRSAGGLNLTAMKARPSPRNMKAPGGSGLRPRCGAAPNAAAAFPARPVAAEAAPTASLRDCHGKSGSCSRQGAKLARIHKIENE
ncbi:NACHT domain-containing protein [Candidatus Thiodictyon syntrophicum]|jgi:hypothetical protein|uniref:NACHT domain-containing protein n=1 Tax=Candidatus Thiodictyon syntrophicum TaxID=1166950 RepID=A0A2K8U3S5_9GAMM|nr:hypothetical protein [Candidatus Thiodictyon syntrophicum]AUB80233.1 hypothetical protein THSYN_04160 [Candidatus Thiodictyon syntrophicum]